MLLKLKNVETLKLIKEDDTIDKLYKCLYEMDDESRLHVYDTAFLILRMFQVEMLTKPYDQRCTLTIDNILLGIVQELFLHKIKWIFGVFV